MKKLVLISGFLILFTYGCKSLDNNSVIDFIKYKKPDKYNLKVIVYRDDIANPIMDHRCYYKIFIDKIDSGRTTVALDSQEKFFTTKIPVNRHLLVVEKWQLDKMRKRYKKLNNIKQPRPDFYYFSTDKNKITVIKVIIGKKRHTLYQKRFEER